MPDLKISSSRYSAPYKLSTKRQAESKVNTPNQTEPKKNITKLLLIGGAVAIAALSIVFRKRISNFIGIRKKETGSIKNIQKNSSNAGIAAENAVQKNASKVGSAVEEFAEKVTRRPDGTIEFIEKIDSKGQTVRKKFFKADGKTLEKQEMYENGEMIGRLYYPTEGKPLNGNGTKTYRNGETIEEVVYLPNGIGAIKYKDGKKIIKLEYEPDGKTVKFYEDCQKYENVYQMRKPEGRQ